VAEKILLHIDAAYNILNLRGHSSACRTNLPSNTAFRGFGVPQTMVVIENMINDVAMTLGRPAEEIREKNMYKDVSLTHYKMEFDPENLQRCWEQCKERADITHRRENITRFNLQHRWRKRGIAIVPIKYGIGFAEGFLNQAAALVHIYKDGSVLISHGGTEMGQGLHTKVQQVASRELNIPLSLIHISETCTSSVPNTCPSAASFGTDANGMAVRDACQTLYKRLEPIRQMIPEGPWQSWIKRAFLEKISLSATGFYRGHDTGMDWEKQEGRPYAYFTCGACCSEVELDCLSGEYRDRPCDRHREEFKPLY
ncbi:aldehyde oxidase 6 isoform X1, partial [Tachysurus ichikawai]